MVSSYVDWELFPRRFSKTLFTYLPQGNLKKSYRRKINANNTSKLLCGSFTVFNPLSVPHHIETSQLIYRANQWTGFYMTGNTGR